MDVNGGRGRRSSGNYDQAAAPAEVPADTTTTSIFSSNNTTTTTIPSTCTAGEVGTKRAAELKKYVKSLLLVEDIDDDDDDEGMIVSAEMIDVVQRLGLGYQFEDEIHKALQANFMKKKKKKKKNTSDESLHACALRFRLLRQAGFMTSQDTLFNQFREERGRSPSSFKPEVSTTDISGLLALYEASHLGLVGEDALEEAKGFAINHLTDVVAGNIDHDHDPILGQQLVHALELPLHWRAHWAETSWFIGLCRQGKMKPDTVPVPLLELAVLDYDVVQQLHQKELQELTRWWEDLGLMERLEFARDALVESFNWAVSTDPEPKMSSWRISTAKVAVLVHVIDDAYDDYGSLHELELFTAAIKRWNVNKVDKLPYYLQLCFMAVYNLGNEMAYVTLKEHRFNSLPYIKRSWVDLCCAYMEEATSYHSGRDQTLEQYLKVGWKSVACAIVLVHGYLSMPGEIVLTDQTLDLMFSHDLTRLTSTIVRLINDLASSKGELERGDVVKSVECYMKEKGVTEEAARDHVEWLIGETWKMVNNQTSSCHGSSSENDDLPPKFVKMAVNVVRASHFVYKHSHGGGRRQYSGGSSSPSTTDDQEDHEGLIIPMPAAA